MHAELYGKRSRRSVVVFGGKLYLPVIVLKLGIVMIPAEPVAAKPSGTAVVINDTYTGNIAVMMPVDGSAVGVRNPVASGNIGNASVHHGAEMRPVEAWVHGRGGIVGIDKCTVDVRTCKRIRNGRPCRVYLAGGIDNIVEISTIVGIVARLVVVLVLIAGHDVEVMVRSVLCTLAQPVVAVLCIHRKLQIVRFLRRPTGIAEVVMVAARAVVVGPLAAIGEVHACVDMQLQVLETMKLIVGLDVAHQRTRDSAVVLLVEQGHRVGGRVTVVTPRP